MRKKLKKLSPVLFAVIFILGMVSATSLTTVYAMSRSAQHNLYKSTMKKYAQKAKASFKKYSHGQFDSSRKVMYVFVDIDKNGTDELIMRYDNPQYYRNTATGSGYGESTSIYTIKNGKVVTVLDNSEVNPAYHQNYVHIFKNRSRIDRGFSHGYEDHIFCKYSNGKLYTGSNFISMTATQSDCSYNGRSISRAAYKSKYNSLTNNGRGYTMKLY